MDMGMAIAMRIEVTQGALLPTRLICTFLRLSDCDIAPRVRVGHPACGGDADYPVVAVDSAAAAAAAAATADAADAAGR